MTDPRGKLEEGKYWATITKSGIVSYAAGAPLVDRLIPGAGEYLEQQSDEMWVDYSLPGCGEWRWRLQEGQHGVTRDFLVNALEKGGFTFIKTGGDLI